MSVFMENGETVVGYAEPATDFDAVAEEAEAVETDAMRRLEELEAEPDLLKRELENIKADSDGFVMDIDEIDVEDLAEMFRTKAWTIAPDHADGL